MRFRGWKELSEDEQDNISDWVGGVTIVSFIIGIVLLVIHFPLVVMTLAIGLCVVGILLKLYFDLIHPWIEW